MIPLLWRGTREPLDKGERGEWKCWLKTQHSIVKLQDIKSIHRNPLVFLYTNNEKTEREIKEIIPFTIETKRIKYLEINVAKEVNDLYIENYTVLLKEIQDDTNICRHPCSWNGRTNIDIECPYLGEGEKKKRMPYSPKQSIDSVQFLSKFQRHILQK